MSLKDGELFSVTVCLCLSSSAPSRTAGRSLNSSSSTSLPSLIPPLTLRAWLQISRVRGTFGQERPTREPTHFSIYASHSRLTCTSCSALIKTCFSTCLQWCNTFQSTTHPAVFSALTDCAFSRVHHKARQRVQWWTMTSTNQSWRVKNCWHII